MIRVLMLLLMTSPVMAQMFPFAGQTYGKPGATPAANPPALDTHASGFWSTAVTTKSVTATFNGVNRLALIKLTNVSGISSVTVNGVSATFVTNNTATSIGLRMELYALLAPTTGSQTVTANFASSAEGQMLVESWTNVNQAAIPGCFTSYATNNNPSGSITDFTVSTSSTVNDTVSGYVTEPLAGAPTGSANSPTVLIDQLTAGSGTEMSITGYHAGAAGTVTCSFHSTESEIGWNGIAVSIRGP